MKLTYYGHSCVLIETAGKRLIIDPFLTGNPSAPVAAGDIRADYVLLTHGHNDHVGDAFDIAKRCDAVVIAPNELAVYAGWQGCRSHPMHIGGSHRFDFGTVKLTLAFHGSGYQPDGEQNFVYMGMPAGVLVTAEGRTIYHAGDTALFGDMKIIGERHAIDLAFLPIGDNFTMGPDDALTAAEWLRAKRVVPIHYNTFPLIAQDGKAFVERLKAAGIEGLELAPGESIEL
jgi:L-ascorbate metabolism protein UlaG (beta-lactamase superfamily)